MSPVGPINLIKGGFVQLDPITGIVLRLIAFQYNPETLTRRLDVIAAPPPSPPPPPREVISFTVSFDAADKLEVGDAAAQQFGILPTLAALQVMLSSSPTSLIVWVSGNKRIVPVRITEMQFVEQAFHPNLNPIRADVVITQVVLGDQDFTKDSRGRALVDAYLNTLQQLAQLEASDVSLASLGLTEI